MADQDTARQALFELIEKLAAQVAQDTEAAPASVRPQLTEQAALLAEAWAWLCAPANSH